MDGTQTRAGHAELGARRRGRFRPLRRLTDDELAAAVAAGDRRAFGAIFERYHQPLYRYCTGILRDPELAADALQNTMIAALRGLEGEERAIALRPWLYRIAHNQSISLVRRRRPEEPLEGEALERLGVAPDTDGATRERLQELLGDLRELPEQQRSALLLRELTGLDYDEVGTALAISPNGARQAVFKARRALQLSVVGRSEDCDTVQSTMSNHDGRFQRRREIRAHLADCAECSAFAATLAQRPRDLEALFPMLPAPAAAAILAETTGPLGDDDKRRRGFPLLVLLAALAVAATAAIAAISGGGGDNSSRPTSAAAPVRPVAAPPAPSKPSHQAPKPRPQPHQHKTPQHRAPLPTAPVSAISGYSTVGERTQVALGDGCDGAPGSRSGGQTPSGAPSCAASGSASGAGGLPYTGLEIGVLVAIALMLLASGLALRRIGSVRTRR